jgi:hypothetical protein
MEQARVRFRDPRQLSQSSHNRLTREIAIAVVVPGSIPSIHAGPRVSVRQLFVGGTDPRECGGGAHSFVRLRERIARSRHRLAPCARVIAESPLSAV